MATMRPTEKWLALRSDDKPEAIFDQHFSVRCPHCGLPTNVSAVSTPRYQYLQRFQPQHVGIVYRCDSCEEPIMLRFRAEYDFDNSRVFFSSRFEQVERPQEEFEYQYLPEQVAEDFREALTSYSNSCFNAFAAMCRRCVQSAAADLGAQGKDKVVNQLKDMKEMAEVDDETFAVLKEVIIGGHDGAHPHLPAVNSGRAAVLLELMKDVMYQLYVRKGKIQEAMALRQAAIEELKEQ